MCDWELIDLRALRLLRFQSLKGIMCDWEPRGLRLRSQAHNVSIPERDYVWLREFSGFCHQSPLGTFQSLKGIMCDWEAPLGFCAISFQGLFQSLKGIMCDWETCEFTTDAAFVKMSFNPWKGLCVIERLLQLPMPWYFLDVSIPERDYVWLRECAIPLRY